MPSFLRTCESGAPVEELKRRKKFEEELEAQEERDQLNAASEQATSDGGVPVCPGG